MGTKSPKNPFHPKDVSLICGATNFDTRKNPTADLKTATYGKLEFMTQKNAMQGKVVGHITSGDALMQPKRSLVRCVLYHREQGAEPSKNLATFKRGGTGSTSRRKNLEEL